MNHFLPLVEPGMVVCDADRLDDVIAAVRSYGRIPVEAVIAHDQLEEFSREHDADPAGYVPVAVSPTSCAVLLPTSGSTGLTKVAEITHEGLQAQLPMLWSYHTQFPRPTERVMFMSTAQWMTFSNLVTTCSVYRITMIISPNKTMPTILHILENSKPTWLLLSPSSAAALSDAARAQQLTSLRSVVVTGASLPAATARRLSALAPQAIVANSYGMTEAMGFVTIAHKDTPFGSIGKIFNIFQYKLADDDGKEITRGNKGELYLKGDWIIKRYIKNEEAYRECATADGWWRTGDVFTEDDDNNLFFVERKRFWFKYLNYHISPEELEVVICSVDGVLEAAVAGGDRGAAAAVVRRPGVAVTKEDIHKAVNSKLIEYKQLRGGIAFVDALPRTHSGKLHRVACARIIDTLVDAGECC